MQDPVFSNSLWSSTAPAAPATAPLEGDLRADVAIIGAGYTGLACALASPDSTIDDACGEYCGRARDRLHASLF